MCLGRSYGVFLCPNVQFFRNFSCNFAEPCVVRWTFPDAGL